MINYIPHDPQAGPVPPMRRTTARPDRPTGRAGFLVTGSEPQKVYAPGTAGFVRWQARQAAIVTMETWEKALGAPITTWAAQATDPRRLLIEPDLGDDINAYYDRTSLSFYHHTSDGVASFSGASTDVVSHEAGHGILDAIRPDLWNTPYLEAGGFHEAFGDVTAIITALSDKATRKALLAVSPDLGSANFVEGTAEDLSDAIRRAVGPTHSASKPRRALNTFRWQLPNTMPTQGGPDIMIAEVHSIARLMSGCFYDLVRAMFTTSGQRTETRLWSVTKTAARLFYKASVTAPEVPRFFQAVGRAMVLADDSLHGGANRQLIGQAFAGHGLALGSQALLAPELALEGDAPDVDRAAGVAAVQPATIRDIRRRLGAASNARATVSVADLTDGPVAKVSVRTEVPLDDIDQRLRGVVAFVDVPALVGASGRSAALLHAPRAGTPTDDVYTFVRSLLANGQLETPTAPPPRSRRRATAAVADVLPTAEKPTHTLAKRGAGQELRRVRFA